jgi:hypothetical protein
MMKKTSKLILALALLFCIITAIPTFQTAHGFSRTIELNQGVYTGGIAVFNLLVGDHVEGSFQVSNLGPYERLFGNGASYEVVDVWVNDPNGHSILNFSSTPSENSFNFNFTAHEQGLYEMWAFSGALDYLKEAKNPIMTLNYEIIEAKLPYPPNPDIMAWWKLDEGNGTTVYDSSWHNMQGTIHGANWTSTNGKYFLSFNGESDYVALPSLPLTNLTALTVSAWINSDLTKPGFIIYNGNLGEFKLGNGDLSVDGNIQTQYSKYANFSVKLSNIGWCNVYASFPMEPNTWHHIVGVWIKGEALKLYVDDALAGENDNISSSGLYAADTTLPGSFFSSLGIYSQAHWDKSGFFKGQINNVMIYNKALNNQEIENLTTKIAQSLSNPKPISIVQQFPMTNIIFILAVVFVAVLLSIAIFVYRRNSRLL